MSVAHVRTHYASMADRIACSGLDGPVDGPVAAREATTCAASCGDRAAARFTVRPGDGVDADDAGSSGLAIAARQSGAAAAPEDEPPVPIPRNTSSSDSV